MATTMLDLTPFTTAAAYELDLPDFGIDDRGWLARLWDRILGKPEVEAPSTITLEAEINNPPYVAKLRSEVGLTQRWELEIPGVDEYNWKFEGFGFVRDVQENAGKVRLEIIPVAEVLFSEENVQRG